LHVITVFSAFSAFPFPVAIFDPELLFNEFVFVRHTYDFLAIDFRVTTSSVLQYLERCAAGQPRTVLRLSVGAPHGVIATRRQAPWTS
jgi:hypothetical protein